MKHPATLNARDAYTHERLMSLQLLRRLGELVAALPDDDTHPRHWGHVGDLGHVNGLLMQAAEFLDRKEG